MSKGFDGRMFLTEAEHETYLRRMPVRYTKVPTMDLCSVCGRPAEPTNPLQAAHVIGFSYGVKVLKLTPDFLDRQENLKPAHRKVCNKSVELSVDDARSFILSLQQQQAQPSEALHTPV